jgi:LysR family transcriptional regulator (chromosome initiation inhibitor)
MSLLSANLEAFIAITKCQTVQGASKELAITQTGVTQRIRALERQLSATLFTRSRRGMMLTHEGHALLRYCQAARDLEGEALAQIQAGGIRSQVRVTITGPTSIMSSRISEQTLATLEKYPEVLLTLKVSDLESRIDDLRSGHAQFAVVSHESVAREMDSKILKAEKYVLVGTKKWKGRKTLDIIKDERVIDFDLTDQTTHHYLRKFKLETSARQERHFVNNNDSLIKFLSAGLGYGVLTAEVAKPWLDSGELIVLNGGATMENPLALAWYPRSEMQGYFQEIIRSIR